MWENIKGETLEGVLFLLPGFIALSIVYRLTEEDRGTIFTQIVQATILTLACHGIWELTKSEWGTPYSSINTTLVAVGLGLAISLVINHDIVHGMLRFIGVTRKDAYNSGWDSTFVKHGENWTTLHVRTGDGGKRRRIYGKVTHWPKSGDRGEIRIERASWLEGDTAEGVERAAVLVRVEQVDVVEFTAGNTGPRASETPRHTDSHGESGERE